MRRSRDMRIIICLLLIIELCKAASLRKDEVPRFRCGYETCPKNDANKLNIHIVPHSHDDVGWLKTVDQYYFGGRMNIQVAGVQYIIDSVVDSLVKDPERKFIYVETAFLWKWWLRQNDERRKVMRSLINEGRLEIIGGGWSMNDEAATHYHSLIDQFTWGFRRLNDTFGECGRPKVGWQIDPFGHSREQASIFAQLGFDGMLLNRIDYQDKEQRLKDKTMEFVWQASPSLGQRANIFTTVLYNHYSAPSGFCFDILCRDEPMIDDPKSPDFNINQKVKAFLEFADKQASSYQTNNIIITMGDDFNYLNAEMYFTNLDKLIGGINRLNGKQYKAFYSTPSCYLEAVNEQNSTWPTKNDDFFPYASDLHSFWTGYYTSRPTLKFFERMGNNFLQVVKQLSSLTSTPDSHELELFREAMGVMQHHDAVTGTEKQHVAEDYARLLHHSMKNGENIAADALRKWLTKKKPEKQAEFHSCLLLNISSCEHTSDNSKFVVTVYNPTSRPLKTYVRLPVQGSQYIVRDFNGKMIVTQMLPVPDQIQKIPGRSSKTTKELVFQAVNVSALGYQSFYVSEKSVEPRDTQIDQSNKELIVAKLFQVSIDGNGRVVVKKTSDEIEYRQSFQYYEGVEGNNGQPANRSSGAYVFRPKYNYTKDLPVTGNIKVKTYGGPLVQEIHQVFNDWVSQIVRIRNDEDYVEFNWLVGPIPIDDKIGKEVVTKYSSNLKNNDEFYTDSNAREMLKRKLNYRSDWNVTINETVSGNYYPINSKISIEDKKQNRRLSALNDRAQGGTSLKEGEIELMLHRRLLHDDAFGVGEALNETAFGEGLVARGQHILIAGSTQNRDELILQEKEQAIQLSLRPWLFISPTKFSFEEWNQYYNMKSEDLIGKLPRNIRILTLEPWKDDHILLRLEHIFEVNESPKYSVISTVDFSVLFPQFDVSAIEMTLGANQQLKQISRLKWKAESNEIPNAEKLFDYSDPITRVIMKPMEIKTFVIKLFPRKR